MIPLLKHALSCTPLAVLTHVVCMIPVQADDSSNIKSHTIQYGTSYFQIEVLQLFSPNPTEIKNTPLATPLNVAKPEHYHPTSEQIRRLLVKF